jgi:hypothetical protein
MQGNERESSSTIGNRSASKRKTFQPVFKRKGSVLKNDYSRSINHSFCSRLLLVSRQCGSKKISSQLKLTAKKLFAKFIITQKVETGNFPGPPEMAYRR